MYFSFVVKAFNERRVEDKFVEGDLVTLRLVAANEEDAINRAKETLDSRGKYIVVEGVMIDPEYQKQWTETLE